MAAGLIGGRATGRERRAPQLLDDRMKDGSRNFLLLPHSVPSLRLIPRILTLWGAFPTAYVPGLDQVWIDFRYQGHRFSINDQVGDYWFFVNDPSCPTEILERVANHFSSFLWRDNAL